MSQASKSKNRRGRPRRGRRNRAGIWSLTGPSTPSSIMPTFPERIRVRLGYVTSGFLGSAFFADQCWNANGLFDPDQTGVGHQPLGFDQWSAMYARYLVHRVRYHITVCQASSTSDTTVGVVVLNGQVSALSSTQMQACIEGMRAKFTILGSNQGQPPHVFRGSVSLAALTGATPERYDGDDRYQAAISANPTELMGVHLFGYDTTLGTNINLNYTARIEYEAEFFDRALPSQSLFVTKLSTPSPLKPSDPPLSPDEFVEVRDSTAESKSPLDRAVGAWLQSVATPTSSSSSSSSVSSLVDRRLPVPHRTVAAFIPQGQKPLDSATRVWSLVGAIGSGSGSTQT